MGKSVWLFQTLIYVYSPTFNFFLLALTLEKTLSSYSLLTEHWKHRCLVLRTVSHAYSYNMKCDSASGKVTIYLIFTGTVPFQTSVPGMLLVFVKLMRLSSFWWEYSLQPRITIEGGWFSSILRTRPTPPSSLVCSAKNGARKLLSMPKSRWEGWFGKYSHPDFLTSLAFVLSEPQSSMTSALDMSMCYFDTMLYLYIWSYSCKLWDMESLCMARNHFLQLSICLIRNVVK